MKTECRHFSFVLTGCFPDSVTSHDTSGIVYIKYIKYHFSILTLLLFRSNSSGLLDMVTTKNTELNDLRKCLTVHRLMALNS